MSKDRTILELDDYSLCHVFSFLSNKQKETVGYACLRFQSIIGPLIGKKELQMVENKYGWEFGNPKKFFATYGAYIKKIYIPYKSSNEFINLLPKYCHNIESARIHSFQNDDSEFVKNLFDSNKNLKHLKTNCGENFTDVVESEHIRKLQSLETLHLNRSLITGEYLNRLTKLRELNLEDCKKLDSKHFIAICERNKLVQLNISGCDGLDTEAFRTLVETQTELEEIQVNHWYNDGEVAQVALLKNLRRVLINFNPDYNDRPTNLLSELSEHCSSSLKLLVIYDNGTSIMRSDDLDKIPTFENLEKLILIEVRNLNDWDLSRISKSCKQLDRLDLPSCNQITNKGIVELTRNLKLLTLLNLGGCSQLGRELYQKMCEAKRALGNNTKLTVYTDQPSILNYITDKQYKTNQTLIKIFCNYGPFDVKAWQFIQCVEQMDADGELDL